MRLTSLEQAFADCLLRSPTLDARSAYLDACRRLARPAGRDPYGASRALYARPKVQAELARRRRSIEQAVDAQAVQLEQRLARIALADLRQLYDPRTGEILPPEDWPDDIAAAVKELETEEETVTRGRGKDAEGVTTVKRTARLIDPMAAIRLLMARRGLATDPGTGGGIVAHFEINL